jgi:hypothetical protein
MTGDKGAHRISMILRKIAPIHAVGNTNCSCRPTERERRKKGAASELVQVAADLRKENARFRAVNLRPHRRPTRADIGTPAVHLCTTLRESQTPVRAIVPHMGNRLARIDGNAMTRNAVTYVLKNIWVVGSTSGAETTDVEGERHVLRGGGSANEQRVAGRQTSNASSSC